MVNLLVRTAAVFLPLTLPVVANEVVGADAARAAARAAAPPLKMARADDSWSQWRGPLATGVAPDADPPVEWSEEKNVRWKVALPGRGHSTPIVRGDHVFVTAAVPFGEAFAPRNDTAPGAHHNSPVTHRHRFVVIAIGRRDGNILWQRTVHEEIPHEGVHQSGTYASSSPVTDGETVFAFFGSHGLYALDLKGRSRWTKQFGKMHTKHGHGEGSSPVLHGEFLVVNWDHEGQSFLVALDKRAGTEFWRVEREEVTSWATPIVGEHDGRPQLIVSGTGRVRGHELATGKVIWECGGLSNNIVASPVAADGMVFAGSSYETRAMIAIRLKGARGNITGTDRVAWTRRQRTPYVPSPLLYGDSLYFLRHYQGILSRIEATTGKERLGPFRLDAIYDVYASPVAAAGRVYVTDRRGMTMVISHDEKDPRVLARNQLDDGFSASAALVGRELFLRGERYLYCLAEAK